MTEVRKTTIYQIRNPFSREIIYVGKSVDFNKRIKAHLWWSHNAALDRELLEIRSAGQQPVFQILEQVERAQAGKREMYWIYRIKNDGHKLHNRLAITPKFTIKGKLNLKEEKKKMPVGEIFFSRTFPFVLELPKEIVEHPKFQEVTSAKDLQVDHLSVYIANLILADLDKEDSEFNDWNDWLYGA